MQIPNSDLKLDDEIGSGGFSTVFRAKWLTHDILVAVKKLHPMHLNREAKQTFLNELSLLNRVSHPHIVTFYGACLEKQQNALVMEYISLGSLYQLLHERKEEISWSDRFSVASQAARGINYLHHYQPQILHRDIKSMNILLKKDCCEYLVKICDFGLAKTRNETTRQITGNIQLGFTLSWAAPEVLHMKTYMDKSDIYSLGIIYWELASHLIPYDGHENNVIREFVLAGDRLEIPSSTPLNFRIIIEKCWAHQPEDRPTCSDLIRMLNECIEKHSKSHIFLLIIESNIFETKPSLFTLLNIEMKLDFISTKHI